MPAWWGEEGRGGDVCGPCHCGRARRARPGREEVTRRSVVFHSRPEVAPQHQSCEQKLEVWEEDLAPRLCPRRAPPSLHRLTSCPRPRHGVQPLPGTSAVFLGRHEPGTHARPRTRVMKRLAPFSR
ncbi:hypothetical protein AAFF_G00253130 [Aldrovandia affinis]|uniref:Uncharacterized protein n=1 Tax=Aldrovandia affinis TaxID=143900 RepID=A0AAD7SUX5_9TELE|nr:hypothetical protein AAFF_G00253130 [Aldrovandia affinis]